MSQLLKILYLLVCSFLLVSCATKIQEGSADMSYATFRKSQQSFATEEGEMKYIDRGRGPVLVLQHGVPTSGWLYRKMIDDIVANGYRVIVPDALGYGSSDNPKGYEIYSSEAHATRMLALMDSLGIKKWTQVCHDVGGLWTWEMLKQAPDRVEKLVILNSVIYAEGFHPPMRMDRGLLAKSSMWMYRNRVTNKVMLKHLYKAGLTKSSIAKLSKADREGYRKPLLEGKTNGMYYFFTQTCNDLPDYSETLKKMDVPVMVIWGQHDEMLVWKNQRDRVTQDLNIKKKYEYVIDAKHFIQEEKPEWISAKIVQFMK